MSKFLQLLFMTFFVAACSSLSKQDCVEQDWREYAQIHAQSSPQSFETISKQATSSCEDHQVIPDNDALKQGYVDGINIYCQSKNIWDKGRAAQKINLLYCPVGNRARLQRVYNAAKDLHVIDELEQQILEQQEQLSKLQRESHFLQERVETLKRQGANPDEIQQASSKLSHKNDQVLKAQNKIAATRLQVGQLRRHVKTFNQVI